MFHAYTEIGISIWAGNQSVASQFIENIKKKIENIEKSQWMLLPNWCLQSAAFTKDEWKILEELLGHTHHYR